MANCRLSKIHHELKWLLKERGWAYFQEPSFPKLGPPHSNVGPPYLKVGPPKYSKIQTLQVCNAITSSIAAKQYSKNSNLYK